MASLSCKPGETSLSCGDCAHQPSNFQFPLMTHLTDALDIKSVTDKFVAGSEYRLTLFGKFLYEQNCFMYLAMLSVDNI